MAIGKLAVGQLALGRARPRRGKVDDLLIARLTIEELRIERALGSGSVDRRRCPVRRGWIRIVRGVTYVRTARNAVALMVLMALAVTVGACSTERPCRGPYGEPCGGPRSGWPGAVTCPSC